MTEVTICTIGIIIVISWFAYLILDKLNDVLAKVNKMEKKVNEIESTMFVEYEEDRI